MLSSSMRRTWIEIYGWISVPMVTDVVLHAEDVD